jgi:hypothetical protein
LPAASSRYHLRWISLPLGIVVVLFILLALLPGPAVFLVVVRSCFRVPNQSGVVRKKMTASCVVLPCTPPTLAAERQSLCSRPSGIARGRLEPNGIPEPKNSSLRKRGNASPPGSRALPVQALPVVVWVRSGQPCVQAAPGQSAPGESTICPILLHRHNMPRPIKDTTYRWRADIELRELPEYPTPPLRVNEHSCPIQDEPEGWL